MEVRKLWRVGENNPASTVVLPRFCLEATRLAVFREVENLRRARMDAVERAAKGFLQQNGLEFVEANFHSKRGEIALIFRDGECLVFVEVIPCPSEDWPNPAYAWWYNASTVKRRYSLAPADDSGDSVHRSDTGHWFDRSDDPYQFALTLQGRDCSNEKKQSTKGESSVIMHL